MTRPATLSSAAERILAGVPREIALSEFLDYFYTADAPGRLASLRDEPPPMQDARLDALLGGIGEYLSKQYRLGVIPPWTWQPHRTLADPWFVTDTPTDAMCEFLTVSSPAEFAHRYIFTESMPLRRASQRR